MGIKLLDDHLINKIAAGEVIERPASIVKELVENAIDAGSDRIEVHIDGGGTVRIEVGDNGAGIAADEVALALERHATSKIEREEDLAHIRTMGFRGEALPSIAAISRLELYTQPASGRGVHAVVEGGRQLVLEPYPTAPGTVVVVRDIFFNTPARKKFLKTPVGEGIQVHEMMTRLALSRPDISVSFSNEKKLYFKTPGNSRLRDAVTAIFGSDYAEQLLDLEWQGEMYTLTGMISKPEFKRVNRKNQVFFVNGRLVRSPMLSRALEEAYRGLLLSREYPAAILFLSLPADQVDVNVHPQKTEVRFRDDQAIFRLLSHSVRSRLESPASAGLNTWSSPGAMTPDGFQGIPYRPGSLGSAPELYQPSEARLIFGPERTEAFRPAAYEAPQTYTAGQDDDLAVIGQCFDSYLVVQRGDTLWLVDQHAAHERICYNQLCQARANSQFLAQVLAFPLAFDLSVAETELLENHRALFRDLGLEIEVIGPASAVLRSAPAQLQGQELEVVRASLELLAEEKGLDLGRELLILMACKQAVKAGQRLSRPEMAMMVKQLLTAEDYGHCPHGRPTILEMTRGELDKRFKRK